MDANRAVEMIQRPKISHELPFVVRNLSSQIAMTLSGANVPPVSLRSARSPKVGWWGPLSTPPVQLRKKQERVTRAY